MLGAPRYAQIPTLRGEIEASSMHIRYFKYDLEREKNELIKGIIQEKIESGRDLWMNTVRKYINEADLGRNSIKETSLREIKEKITKWDTEKWKREVVGENPLN